jgi:hypothetical protein
LPFKTTGVKRLKRRGSGRARVSLLPRLARWAGVGVFVLGAGILSCDDNGTGPVPYDGPWEVVDCPDLPDLHYLTGVHFVNADLGYCAGGPYILKWDGVSWKKDYELIPTPPYDMASCYDVFFLNENDGWVAGGEGTASMGNVVILHWDGNIWERVPQDLPMDYVYCIFFLDENHGWIGGDGIAKWDGSEWSYDADIAVVKGIFFNSPTDGWAVSKYNESIYHYDGATWTRVHDDPWGIELYSIWFTSPDHGWAGGMGTNTADESNIMEYKNGDWFPYLEPPWDEGIRRDVNAVHFSGPNNGWAVGQKTYRWDGKRWWYVDSPRPETGVFTDVFAISDRDAWAVTEGAEILHYQP